MIQKISLFVLVLGLGLLVGPSADAGNPYILNISSPPSQNVGGIADVLFSLDNTGVGLTGWGWGVCQSGGNVATIESVDEIGTDAGALDGGDGPEFLAVTVLPSGDGWTVGAIVELVGNGTLAPGIGVTIHNGRYLITGPSDPPEPPGFPPPEMLTYCSTLGSPAVLITLTLDGGGVSDENSGDLTLNGGSVAGQKGEPPFISTLTSAEGTYDDEGNGADIEAFQGLREDPSAGGLPTQGYSLGFALSGPCTLDEAEPFGILWALDDGDGPEFFGANTDPVGGPGYTVGVVYALLGGSDIIYTTEFQPLIRFVYELDAGALEGQAGPFNCDLTHSDMVGMPFVANTIVAGAISPTPVFEDGRITLTLSVDTPHVKGDCNDDGIVNIADGINIINVYIVGSPPVGDCVNACDVNADGIGPDISDAIFVFNYRFLGGPPPPENFPDCGIRVDSDCNSFNSCP